MLRIMSRFLLPLLVCCCCKILNAQVNKNIDSLFSVLRTAREDTSKVNTLNFLSRQLRAERSDYLQAKKYAEDALALSEKLSFKKGIANADNNIGYNNWSLGSYPEGIRNHSAALEVSLQIGYKQGLADAYDGLAGIYIH